MQYRQEQMGLFVPEAKKSLLGLRIINWGITLTGLTLVYGGVLLDSKKPDWMQTNEWDFAFPIVGIVLGAAPYVLGTKEQQDKFEQILEYEAHASRNAQKTQIVTNYMGMVLSPGEAANGVMDSKVGILPTGYSEAERLAAHVISYLGENFEITIDYVGHYQMPRAWAIELRPGKGFGKSNLTKHIDNIQSELGLDTPPIFTNGKGCIECEIANPDFEPLDFEKYCVKPENKGIFIPIGLDKKFNLVTVDLTSPLGFSGMIFGMSGSGKTLAVMQVLSGLAKWYQPEEIQIAISDMKGGADYSLYQDSDYIYQNNIARNTNQTLDLLGNIVELIEYRNSVFAETQCRNIDDFNKKFPDQKMPIIFCIFDEIAALVRDKNKSDEADVARELLLKISTLCRSSGIKLWLAVQKPLVSEIPSVVLGNLPCRVGLMVETSKESEIGIGYGNYCNNLLGEGDGYLKYKKKIKRFQGLFITDNQITNIFHKNRRGTSGGDFSNNNDDFINVSFEEVPNTDDTKGGDNWWSQKRGKLSFLSGGNPKNDTSASADFPAKWKKWLETLYLLDCEGKLFVKGGLAEGIFEDAQTCPKPPSGVYGTLNTKKPKLPIHLELLIVSSKDKKVNKKPVVLLLFGVTAGGSYNGKDASELYTKVLKKYKKC